jgi:formamidopyrimidine-DNA glycosylase
MAWDHTPVAVPELPDIALYLHALAPRIVGRRLDRVQVTSPFLVRSVDPPLSAIAGTVVASVERLGKRVVLALDGDFFLVLHLMIGGRLHWRPPGPLPRTRATLAGFVFEQGVLTLTEAGSKRRASLAVVRGRPALADLDPGGIDVLASPLDAFAATLTRENHTLKRALTDPRLFDGIGNAYSDEILHAARLSPLLLTSRLTSDEVRRLHEAARSTLTAWIERLRAETGDRFPEKVTAFREGMAVHGRYGEPCPRCGSPVQRISYADRECNYCAECQLGGRLLADRGLSRLLRDDWPKTLEDLEEFKEKRRER